MARQYSTSSGLTSIAASTTKVAAQLATPSTLSGVKVIGFDITFDSTATGAGAVPIRVELVRESTASSGGASATPRPYRLGQVAAETTARVNDTTDGTVSHILASWLVSPTAGLVMQFPLGREPELDASDFIALRLITQAGMTTCNYEANIHHEA